MSVYSQFASQSYAGGETIEANEVYCGAIGAFEMMEESSINQHTIFEHVLGMDFLEEQTKLGYVSEASFEAVNEASGTGIFSKVIAFFKKLGEKIKGIIENFIRKVQAMFTKDGKQLVKKFEKQVTKNQNQNKLGDSFKYQWATPDINKLNGLKGLTDISSSLFGVTIKSNKEHVGGKTIEGVLDAAKTQKNRHDEAYKNNPTADNSTAVQNAYDAASNDDDDSLNPLTSDELSDYKDNVLQTISQINNTDASSFAKDFDEDIFESVEQKEGFNSVSTTVKNFLTDYDKQFVSKAEKAKKDTDKSIHKIVKQAEDIQRDMSKAESKGGYTQNAQNARARASQVIAMGNVLSACASMYFTAVGAATKKMYKQCRSVWIKAATVGKAPKNEAAVFFEAVGEVSDYEVDMMMPEF